MYVFSIHTKKIQGNKKKEKLSLQIQVLWAYAGFQLLETDPLSLFPFQLKLGLANLTLIVIICSFIIGS